MLRTLQKLKSLRSVDFKLKQISAGLREKARAYMVNLAVAAIIGTTMSPRDEFDNSWALSVIKIAAFIVIPQAEQSAIG
jgi:hypothetical protein